MLGMTGGKEANEAGRGLLYIESLSLEDISFGWQGENLESRLIGDGE